MKPAAKRRVEILEFIIYLYNFFFVVVKFIGPISRSVCWYWIGDEWVNVQVRLGKASLYVESKGQHLTSISFYFFGVRRPMKRAQQ